MGVAVDTLQGNCKWNIKLPGKSGREKAEEVGSGLCATLKDI